MSTTNPQPQPPQQQWLQPPRRRNGFGVAALVLGIIGFIFALIPLFGIFIAWPCAVLAVVFGGVGMIFAFKGRANKGVAIAGTVLGIAALVVSIVETNSFVNDTSAASSSGSGAAHSSSQHGASGSSGKHSGDSGSDTATFGKKFTYGNGLEVEVTKITQSTVGSDDISGNDDAKPGDRTLVFTTRIKNGTKHSYDATLADVEANYGSDGDEADPVFGDSNTGDGFTGKIPAHGAKTAKFGFAIPAKADKNVTVEVDPGAFELDSVLFRGSVEKMLS